MGREPLVRILLAALALAAVFGCGSRQEPMSKEERENFKGGPMPSGFLEKTGAAPNKSP